MGLNKIYYSQICKKLRGWVNNLPEDDIKLLKRGGVMKKGGKFKIHIKKSKRGSFTSYCGGKVTNECIRRGKNSPNAAIRKKAVFAENARKWKH